MYFVISFGALNNLLLVNNGSKLVGFQRHETCEQAEDAAEYLSRKSIAEYGGDAEAYANDPATTGYQVYSLKGAVQYVLEHSDSYDDTRSLNDFIAELSPD
jgi:hypothetical protein